MLPKAVSADSPRTDTWSDRSRAQAIHNKSKHLSQSIQRKQPRQTKQQTEQSAHEAKESVVSHLQNHCVCKRYHQQQAIRRPNVTKPGSSERQRCGVISNPTRPTVSVHTSVHLILKIEGFAKFRYLVRLGSMEHTSSRLIEKAPIGGLSFCVDLHIDAPTACVPNKFYRL